MLNHQRVTYMILWFYGDERDSWLANVYQNTCWEYHLAKLRHNPSLENVGFFQRVCYINNENQWGEVPSGAGNSPRTKTSIEFRIAVGKSHVSQHLGIQKVSKSHVSG